MNAADKPDRPSAHLQEVSVVRSGGNYDPERGWQSQLIYRWHGRVIEVWRGPSSDSSSAKPACQLRQGTAEVAFLDIGDSRSTLGRRAGTVFGELVSFEQTNPGLLPTQRTIEVRLAIKQSLRLDRWFGDTTLLREDGEVISRFAKGCLHIHHDATAAEAILAMLIDSSGILQFLNSPLLRWLVRDR